MLAQPDDGGDVLGVVVGEALHQDLLVGPPRPDLQPLQVEQLLEDAPLDLVPREGGGSKSTFITSKWPSGVRRRRSKVGMTHTAKM